MPLTASLSANPPLDRGTPRPTTTMRSLLRSTLSLAATLGLLLAAGLASAQVGTDYPNLKGGNARTGVAGDPTNAATGFLRNASTAFPSGSLRWFRGGTGYAFGEVAVDNTDDQAAQQRDGDGNLINPYIPNAQGISSRFPAAGAWNYVTDTDIDNGAAEAQYLYVPYRADRAFTFLGNNYPANFGGRTPRYEYATTTPSSTQRFNGRLDPRVPTNAANLKTFTWSLTPTSATPQNLALYAWIPEGGSGQPALYRQRYFVYEITYGTGQKYVDVVDTRIAGVGFVRLGAGGRPTNQLFPYAGYDGTGNPYPVSIKLFNTVPRNAADNTLTDIAGSTLVYADAVKYSAYVDSYFATPTAAGFLAGDVRTVGSRNDFGLLAQGSNDPFLPPVPAPRGTVTSHTYDTGLERWSYTPDSTVANKPTFDNGSLAFTTSVGFTPKTIGAVGSAETAYGPDYLSAATVVGADPTFATEQVEVRPGAALAEGDYEISMYLNGGTNPEIPGGFARTAFYEIFENGVSQGVFTLNQVGARGFTRLGNRKYRYVPANVGAGVTEQPLYVRFYNVSPTAIDAGTRIEVDAVRFNDAAGNFVVSTPVHARALVKPSVAADPIDTNVVLIADESGRISCVDAVGNNDGTTRVYWTYPSTPDIAGTDTDGTPLYKDPNTNVGGPTNGFDGANNVQQAELPPSFDLSTAVVVRLNVGPAGSPVARDFLVIGGSNGRVYSVAMEGRGDGTTAAPGTTYRRWTFPATYPSNTQPTRLGQISSVVSGAPGAIGARETVYVGTEAGKMYALDAAGGTDSTYNDPGLAPQQRWQYPLGTGLVAPIVGAPALDVAGNRLFFGTVGNGVLPSSVLALNASTGVLQWQRDYSGGFRSGVAYVPAAELNAAAFPAAPAMPNTVYAMSDNNTVYALDADNTGNFIWQTGELQGGGRGSLGFARITTYDRTGNANLFPVITVPTEGGRFAALFARLGDETTFATIGDPLGNRQAWGSRIDAPIVASMTNASNGTAGNGFLYGASTNGFLFGWSTALAGGGGGGGFIYPPPITEDVTDNNNDPEVADYRRAKVALLSRQGFINLRRTQAGTNTSQYNYGDVVTGAPYSNPFGSLTAAYRSNRPVDPTTGQVGFEWGETIYLIVYDFKAPTVNANGDPVAPPVVEVSVSTEGKPARPIVAEARVFKDRTPGSAPDSAYAVVQIPITSGGQTAFPPGDGIIKVAVRTSATNGIFVQQAISLNPRQSVVKFVVANPLAIAMTDPFTGALLGKAYQMGTINDATAPDRVNGSPQIVDNTNFPGRTNSSLLLQSFGSVQHGQSKKTAIIVYDRSLMTLLRGPGRGLDNVRVDRRDMEWQGGALSVEKPFVTNYGALFAKFEDLPVNVPNTSLDYPDIRRERVRVTKDPDGAAENPIFGGVSLTAPTVGGGAVTDANAPNRVIQPTPFVFQLDAPKYQPPSYLERNTAALVRDSAGYTDVRLQGYGGRFSVYVDSDGNGSFATNREAYRGFNLFGKILADERLTTVTPTVDLGAVAAGTGYDSSLAYTAAPPYRTLGPGSVFSPWSGAYAGLFQPFTARNDGNVNLLNVRVAKGTEDGALRYPWQITSVLNDETSTWLDASLDLWSDLDKTFAPFWAAGRNEVIAPKPRVGDLQGRDIQANPIARFNPNIPASGTPLIANTTDFPVREPRVGVSIPLGFPVGPYVQTIRLIEDYRERSAATTDDENLSLAYTSGGRVDPQETYADPGLRLAFTITETQLTGGTAVANAPGSKMVDAGTAVTQANPSGYASRQPAAVRASNGAVAMVFSSNRPLFEPVTGTIPGGSPAYRLWVSSLAGGTPGNPRTGFAPDSQTRDLNKFTPSGPTGGFWSQQYAAYPNGTAAARFPDIEGATGTPVEGTQTYGNPALPTAGFTDPTQYGAPGATVFPTTTLAFVGSVFRDASTGRATDSRLFVAPLSLAQDGTTQIGEPVPLNYDPLSRKGKPAVVRSNAPTGGLGATIIYPATTGNSTSLFITRYTDGGDFTKPLALTLGNAFESASEPSATIRNYANGGQVLDLVFSGRLRGRAGNEIFQMSLVLGADHLPVKPIRFIYYRVRGERATLDATSGSYRVRGAYLREPGPDPVAGNPNALYDDKIYLRGLTTDLRTATGAAGARIPETDYRTDRETRIESSTSPTLGGQIYLDRGAGSFRVVGGVLPRTRDVIVDYDSAILRVSGNEGAGYGTPNLLRDSRLAPSNTAGTTDAYWFQKNGNPSPPNATDTYSDRTYLLYTRAAQPGGQTTRPFAASYRIGTRIGFTLLTNADGTLRDTVAVAGSVGPYQVDPAGGRIYFTRLDEGNVVNITINGTTYSNIPIGFVSERDEQAVPLGRAINEANLTAFLDPVFNAPGESYDRRNLVWMFWTSTRNGTPNVFMQTLAPKLIPFVPTP